MTLKQENKKKVLRTALYLHIPFCESKCGYCAFNSLINKNHLQINYMEKLANYLQEKIKKLQTIYARIEITSVYIGGGTPSIVQAHLYEKIFEIIESFVQEGSEITVEANPNSLGLEWLQTMCSYGVNRLSLGVQSFEKKKLEFLEREHKVKNTYEAIEIALKVGLENLSVDLIYGTPLCTESLLEKELEIVSRLPLSHISAYHLSIDEGSRFYKKKDCITLNEEEFGGFLSIGHFVAAHLNLPQYEVSNYGRISRHNLNYWQGNNYLGIGAGAVGFLENIRTSMPQNLEVFLDGFVEKKEYLSAKDLELEHLFLGFRSCVGVLAEKIPNQSNLKTLLEEEKVFLKENRVFSKDYFLGDEIALFLS